MIVEEESVDFDMETPVNYKPSLNTRKTVKPHTR